jgi:hypothetical protein
MLYTLVSKIKIPKREEVDMEDDNKDEDEEEEESNEGTISLSPEEKEQLIKDVLPSLIHIDENQKIKKLSEGIFKILVRIFKDDFSFFLKRIMSGFAGDRIETKAATLSILSDLIK